MKSILSGQTLAYFFRPILFPIFSHCSWLLRYVSNKLYVFLRISASSRAFCVCSTGTNVVERSRNTAIVGSLFSSAVYNLYNCSLLWISCLSSIYLLMKNSNPNLINFSKNSLFIIPMNRTVSNSLRQMPSSKAGFKKITAYWSYSFFFFSTSYLLFSYCFYNLLFPDIDSKR